MRFLSIELSVDGATQEERGELFRHLEKLGPMGGFVSYESWSTSGSGDEYRLAWTNGTKPLTGHKPGQAPEGLTVTVTGPTASGKTILADQIRDFMKARGLELGEPERGLWVERTQVKSHPKDMLKSSVRTETIELKVDAQEAVAAIDAVATALEIVKSGMGSSKLVEAAELVLLGVMVPDPKIDMTHCESVPFECHVVDDYGARMATIKLEKGVTVERVKSAVDGVYRIYRKGE